MCNLQVIFPCVAILEDKVGILTRLVPQDHFEEVTALALALASQSEEFAVACQSRVGERVIELRVRPSVKTRLTCRPVQRARTGAVSGVAKIDHQSRLIAVVLRRLNLLEEYAIHANPLGPG